MLFGLGVPTITGRSDILNLSYIPVALKGKLTISNRLLLASASQKTIIITSPAVLFLCK